jgi:hypothetical protein
VVLGSIGRRWEIYGPFYSHVGPCDNPNFRDPGLFIAIVKNLIIGYLAQQKLIVPDHVVVVGGRLGCHCARQSER